jgi:chemotaxis protein CheX
MRGLVGTPEAAAELERYLDRAMQEVFGTMLGVECDQAELPDWGDRETIAALIGLAGAMTGSLVLQSEARAGMRVAELMTGVGPEEVDATTRDAMGEMGNMVAGAWKGYDPVLASKCLLSTPTVVVGQRYELFSRKAAIQINRAYRFEGFQCTVSVACQLAG